MAREDTFMTKNNWKREEGEGSILNTEVGVADSTCSQLD